MSLMEFRRFAAVVGLLVLVTAYLRIRMLDNNSINIFKTWNDNYTGMAVNKGENKLNKTDTTADKEIGDKTPVISNKKTDIKSKGITFTNKITYFTKKSANNTNTDANITKIKTDRNMKTSFKNNSTVILANNKLVDDMIYHNVEKNKFNKSSYDIMATKSITFNESFKNPCWIGDGRHGPFNDGKLHCLPYFYILGVKKSGTTDFEYRLRKHPDYCRPFIKESQWFAKRRFGIWVKTPTVIKRIGHDFKKTEYFSAMFDGAANCIKNSPNRREESGVKYRKLTAEASPSSFHMHTYWELLPGNENLTEPRFTNFHYIKHLTPEVKVIVLFRDPVKRLYSDFLHNIARDHPHWNNLPALFHKDVTTLIAAYRNCIAKLTLRACVYSNILKESMKRKGVILHKSFNAGFYAVFMKDILKVFGKARVLTVLTDEYITRMKETLGAALNFLEMADVSQEVMERMLQSPIANARRLKHSGQMLNVTRDLLYEFFSPYNDKMAALMKDSRYRFAKGS